MKSGFTSGATLRILLNEWSSSTICIDLILVVLQVVHLDLTDVSTCDCTRIAMSIVNLSLHILLTWICHEICNSEHLSLIGSIATLS